MAIDLGTASTIIAVKGRDIVLDEPSYIAYNELTSDIVAYGQEAYDMIGPLRLCRAAWSPILSGRKECLPFLSKNRNPAARRFRRKP
jgi:rod shape-determining protein MreB